jgi:hypothetical protein
MSVKMFDTPVFVRDGEHFIKEVACLEDALDFLYEWPEEKHGAIYETALRACQRAFDSDYPLAAARDAFVGFAKWANILEEVIAPPAWMVAPKPGQGGMIA